MPNPNRLISETSPYLLQHAYNPVDWFPWCDEAFQKAKLVDKPILLSIGYSACHWCHVMEKESFENETIAGIMNDNFVNIKIDREERPDIDNIYMNFVQLTTGNGGWPMTVFLTPDKIPFYGGTYFPPEDRYGRAGFKKVLNWINKIYQDKRKEIDDNGFAIRESLQQLNNVNRASDSFSNEFYKEIIDTIKKNYDSKFGGFGSAPKFPNSMVLTFLLDFYCIQRNNEILEIVETSVQRLSNGGLYDHLGGGFHRYSTDSKWLVPHFEKMLYDNALLVTLLSKLFMITQNLFYRNKTEETLEYILREMTGAEGEFYSTQDADSEGEEGNYYTWTKQQVFEILNPKEANIITSYFDITDEGNFEGKNILHVKKKIKDFAASINVNAEIIATVIEKCKITLLKERGKRVKPLTDNKILVDWNGLMITAFCYGYRITNNKKYLQAAKKNAEFILNNLQHQGKLYHTHRMGQSKINGFLEDYANLSLGLISLYEVSSKVEYLMEAYKFSKIVLEKFYNDKEKYFYQSSLHANDLIIRPTQLYDNAVPSGNSSSAALFFKLGKIFENEKYIRICEDLVRTMTEKMKKNPLAFGCLLSESLSFTQGSREVILFGGADERESREFQKVILNNYYPNEILIHADVLLDQKFNYLKHKETIENKTTVFICKDFACQSPIDNLEELKKVLLFAPN